MTLLGFILLTSLVGLIVWAVTTYVAMPAPFKTFIIFGSLAALVFLLLRVLGILQYADIKL